jgi:arabinan endo-1,5-alpha-L-arabinosidase
VAILYSPEGTPLPFKVGFGEGSSQTDARTLEVEGPGPVGERRVRTYALHGAEHVDYLHLFERLSADFGTRAPLSRGEPAAADDTPLQPLLTRPLSPDLVYGYGDPCVIHVPHGEGGGWYLLVTSNDAPNAFPILRSDDLLEWSPAGFVFPEGQTPGWALTGANLADFWAPEMHRVNGEFWVCFVARRHDRSLAIGLAKSRNPVGPFKAADAPLVTGGVIDPHILIDRDGTPLLLWKTDSNDLWPRLMSELLHQEPALIEALFPDLIDQRTASLLSALWPWVRSREPMEQFFLLQPMIEAVTDDFDGMRDRLRGLAGAAQVGAILDAFRTRIFAQPMAPDGSGLVGEPTLILENDQPWEAHLIEGVWTVEHAGRYYMLYAGNDFSTPHYAIGAAVADHPLGPYRKLARPLLRSSGQWWGPGHPSVAHGPDGLHRVFLHAFFPGEAGYKAFRVLLTSEIRFEDGEIKLIG